jgi:hypothetical protein
VPLALMALVGTLGFNFQVVLPLLAKFSFDGGASTYAAMVSAMAVGSIVGALVNGAHGQTGPRLIAGGALAFGVLGLLAASMPTLALEIPMLALLGAAPSPSRRRSTRPAAGGRAEDARPGDGALLGRLPRLDPDRRSPDRLARGNLRPRVPCCWPASPASRQPGRALADRSRSSAGAAASRPRVAGGCAGWRRPARTRDIPRCRRVPPLHRLAGVPSDFR